jgi:hypothetical protein
MSCGGSGVTEAALKLARQYHKRTGSPGKYSERFRAENAEDAERKEMAAWHRRRVKGPTGPRWPLTPAGRKPSNA